MSDPSTNLTDLILESTQQWVLAVKAFPDEEFNTMPPGKWSAAQVVMHLVLTEKGVNNILIGTSQPAERDPLEKMARMEAGLSNRDRVLQAPESLNPHPKHYDKKTLLDKFFQNREMLIQLLESGNMHDVFTSFTHHHFGEMTGVEWGYFVLHHAGRHKFQFNELSQQRTDAMQTQPLTPRQ